MPIDIFLNIYYKGIVYMGSVYFCFHRFRLGNLSDKTFLNSSLL